MTSPEGYLEITLVLRLHCFILHPWHGNWSSVLPWAAISCSETLLIQAAFGAQFRKLSDLWQVRKLIGAYRSLSILTSDLMILMFFASLKEGV